MPRRERQRERIENVLVEILVLALVILPVVLFGGRAEVFAAPIDFLGIVLLALTAWTYARRGPAHPVTRRKLVYDEPWFALGLLLGFAALHLVQLVPLPRAAVTALAGWRPAADRAWSPLTPYPEATWRALLSWLPAIAVFAAVTLRYDARAQARRLIGALFFLAAAVSLYGIVETTGGREMIWSTPKTAYLGAVTGTFVNRNNFAAFASLAFGGGLGLALYYRSKLNDDPKPAGGVERLIVFAFVGVLCLLGILLSKSRGGIAGVMLAGFPTAWLLAERRGRRAFALLAAAVLLGALAMGWWVGREPLGQRFATIAAEAGAGDARPAAWWTALRAAAHGLPLGVGAGTFVDQFRMIPDSGILVRYNHAHCDPLELLAENGLLGLLAMIGALAWVLARSVRALRERHSRFARSLTIGGLAGLAAVLFHSLVDFPLQNPGVRIPFFAMLGVVYLVAHRRLTR